MSADVKPLEYLRAVRNNRELSTSEKLVALLVMSHAGPDGLEAHPGEKLLAAEAGMSEKTVRKYLRSLREKGWLLMIFSGRGGNHEKASVFHLAIPTGRAVTGWSEAQPVTEGSPTGKPGQSQPVTEGNPTGKGYRTNALELAPRNASVNAAEAETPAAPSAAMADEKKKLKSRRIIRRAPSPPAGSCEPGCWLGPGHYGDCRTRSLQPAGKGQ